jgi:hypothetical protein
LLTWFSLLLVFLFQFFFMGAMAAFGPEATATATVDASGGGGYDDEQSKEIQTARVHVA